MINVFSSSFAKQDNVGELNKTKPEKGNTEFDLLPLVNTTQTRVRGPGASLGKMISGARPVLISILKEIFSLKLLRDTHLLHHVQDHLECSVDNDHWEEKGPG